MKYLPLKTFESVSNSDVEYIVCLDHDNSVEDKHVRLSCDCRGWIFSGKRNQKKGVLHRTCKHTISTESVMIGHWDKTNLNEMDCLDIAKKTGSAYKKTTGQLLEHHLNDVGKFLNILDNRELNISVLTVCPRCQGDNETQEYVITCSHCGSDYCE